MVLSIIVSKIIIKWWNKILANETNKPYKYFYVLTLSKTNTMSFLFFKVALGLHEEQSSSFSFNSATPESFEIHKLTKGIPEKIDTVVHLPK